MRLFSASLAGLAASSRKIMNIKQVITPFDKGFSKKEHRAGSRPFNSYQRSKRLKKWMREVFRNKVPAVFAEGEVHLCSARGKWNLKALLEQELVLGDFVVKHSLRSQSKNPQKQDSLVLELLLVNSQQSYIYIVEDRGYDLSVISSDANVAEQVLLSLRKEFLPDEVKAPKKKEVFFNLIDVTKQNVKSKRIKMRENYQLTSDDLNLHYGDQFADWEQRFIEKLGAGSQGLTILRGDPGTGKTYFIRHLISRLRETHIFYLINLTDFDLLTSPTMVEFWSEEMRGRDHPFDIKGDRKTKKKMKRVIIIEDAERLLSVRTKDSSGSVSELLNMCDGLLGDFLQVHLVCTANCPVDDFDPAVVRSGRLTAMKEFVPLDSSRAREIAGKIDVELEEGKKYTLAEIYNQTSNGAEDIKEAPRIGFMGGSEELS